MENQDSRLYRQWPNVDLNGFRNALIDTLTKRQLRYMDDVTVDKPTKGQCLIYNGERWIAGSITPAGEVVITNHASLTGLDSDDHPQYLNNERASELFYTIVEVDELLRDKALISDVDELASLLNELNEKPLPSLEELSAAPADHNHNESYYTKTEVDQQLTSKADNSKIYSHKALSDLESDDHKQYLNEVRGDLRYHTKTESDQLLASKADMSMLIDVQNKITDLENKPNQGVADHSDLTGLDKDNHPQYLNQDRGDSRYYTKTEVNNSLSSKADVIDLNDTNSRVAQLESRTAFDSANYYNKSSINSLLADKANISETNSLTNRISSLENRSVFDSSLYFTKNDVNSLLSGKTNIADTNSLTNRVSILESRNLFDPALYYAKTNIDNFLSGKVNTSELTSLTGRVTTLESRQVFDGSLYFNKTDINSLLNDKASISDISLLSNKVNLLESYDYPLSEYGIHCLSAPLQTALSGATMTSGKLWLTRVLVPANVAINKIIFYVRTVGSLPSAATSGVAVYSNTGTLLGSVLSNALFTTLGWKTATLSTGIPAQNTARFVWIGAVCNFSTVPAISGLTATPVNGGVVSTHRRNISIAATTTFPASFTPASYGTNEDVLPLLCLGA